MITHESRKKVEDRPENDFYQTPKCCTWELVNNYLKNFDRNVLIFDCCCGYYAIGNVLRCYGFKNIIEKDIIYGYDFLNDTPLNCDLIVMNPPFKNFDEFVYKAKETANVVCCIGKLNFFGAHKRNINGLWKHLKYVYVFDRQIAYDRDFREDGKVECGMLITGWFIWDKEYNGEPMIKIIDMQKYIIKK